jgi:hypothetical protein
MSSTCHAIAFAVATCVAQQLAAVDFVVSGEEAVQLVQNSVTSSVQTATFIVTRVGSNWSIINDYTNSGAREYITWVDGRSYSATWDIAGTASSGLVMDRPADRLDASTEFTRVLIAAFLLSGEPGASLTNPPVGFLFPRHPGLHCYRWEMERSPESPFLPERVRFQLDKELVKSVPREAVTYFFRSGYRDQALFRRFQDTQRNGAEYAVTSWTNWGGFRIPIEANLTHTHFDHMDGKSSFRRLFVINVTGLGRPASKSLVPPLLPGSSVQEIVGGACYLYTTANGNYLSPGQAKGSWQSAQARAACYPFGDCCRMVLLVSATSAGPRRNPLPDTGGGYSRLVWLSLPDVKRMIPTNNA